MENRVSIGMPNQLRAWRRIGRRRWWESSGRGSASSGPPRVKSGKRRRLAALHGSADYHVMAAPGVIAAVAGGGLEGAAEIGLGESGDVIGQSSSWVAS